MTKEQKDKAVEFLETLEKPANDYNNTPIQKGDDSIYHLNLAAFMGERVALFLKRKARAK